VSGSGKATNSGVNFQHRVGAVAMLAMLTDIDGLGWLQIGAKERAITELRFETNDGIDDIVIVTGSSRIYIQAKRSLSLSEKLTSEFSLVLKQFVDQFVRAPATEDEYVLATSPSASRRITSDLRKLTEARRLNELGVDANPLTEAEKKVLATTYSLLAQHFEDLTGGPPTDEQRDAIFGRISVAALDLEAGGSLERAVLTVLASRASTPPTIVWGSLIAFALTLASGRTSVDTAALSERFGEHFDTALAGSPQSSTGDGMEFILEGGLPAGREVILMTLDDHLVLAELIRFAPDGTKSARFTDDTVEMTNGVRAEVLLRAATSAGMRRLIESDPSILKGRELTIWPIYSDEDPEATPWAQAHSALMTAVAQKNSAPLECLQCGRPISEHLAPSIEIDQEDLPHQVGLIHSECLRPTHRVIGVASGDALVSTGVLTDFDYRAWFSTRPTGQALFNGVSSAIRGQIVHIGWKPARQHTLGNWGVAYHLDDGSVRYVHERARVQRMTQGEAEAQAAFMSESIDAATDRNDPICVTSAGDTFGSYSTLLHQQPGNPTLKVTSAEPRELTRATVLAQNAADNYYAPLLLLVDADTGTPFVVDGSRVLLTEPLTLAESIKNWEMAGLDVPRFATSILRSDDQFDAFVAEAIRDGVGIVIDPIIDGAGIPVSGFAVIDIETALLADGERS
jgi:hypothetical protein